MTEMQFKGVTKGFHGPVTATITVDNNQLTDVTAEFADTAFVGGLGIERMIEKMKANQTVKVDAVSGATYSSKAFQMAAQKAYAVATGDLTPEEALNPDNTLPEATQQTHQEKEAKTTDKIPNTSIAKEPVNDDGNMTYDETYDVVIVGAGGAGVAAAAEAAQNGLSVVIYEKAGIPGGTTNYSGGVIQAAGTKYQKELTEFKDDTPEKHAQVWVKAGENIVDEALVRDLAEGAPKNIDWLAEMGLNFNHIYGHSHIPYVDDEFYTDRIHQYEKGGGSGSGALMIKAMLQTALDAGAEIVYEASVISLIQDQESKAINGAVVLVGGSEIKVKANKGVVLAAASIDHNPALAKDFSPQHYQDLVNKKVLSTKTNTGDGIIMGMSVGAAVSGMGGTIDFDGKTGNATNNTVPTIPLVHVNGIGKRFVCEDATYGYQFRAIFQQEQQHDAPTYMIFGENSISEPGSAWTPESLAKDVEKNVVLQADTIEKLAQLIGVPTENLQETLEQWNKHATNNEDPEFGRVQGVKPIEAPYYAHKNVATNLGSLGGLKINVDCQVLDNFNQVIDGLYATGLNAGGWIGGYYPGSGTAIAGIVHQGRKASQHLVKDK